MTIDSEKYIEIDENLKNGIPIDGKIFNDAIISGDIDTIKYLYKMRIDEHSVTIALKNNRIEIAKYLLINKAYYDNYSVYEAFNLKNTCEIIEILDLMENFVITDNKFYNLSTLIENSIKSGNNEIIKYIFEKNKKTINEDFLSSYKYSFVYLAIIHGNLETIKYFEKMGMNNKCKNKSYNCYIQNYIDFAIKSGKLDILKYFFSINCEHITKNIIENIKEDINNLDIIEYFNEIGLLSPTMLNNASKTNNLKIIKYLVEKGIKSNSSVLIASQNGNDDTVKYLVENKFYISESSVGYYSKNNNIEMVKYLIDNGCIINNTIFNDVDYFNIDMLKYLLEQTKIQNITEIINKIRFNIEILKYLFETYQNKIENVQINLLLKRMAWLFDEKYKKYCFDIIKYLCEKKSKTELCVDINTFYLSIDLQNMKILRYFIKNDICPIDKKTFEYAVKDRNVLFNFKLIKFLYKHLPISKKIISIILNCNCNDEYRYKIIKYMINRGAPYRKSDKIDKIIDRINTENKTDIEKIIKEQIGNDIGCMIIEYL
jgi:ankyrin repeat protein